MRISLTEKAWFAEREEFVDGDLRGWLPRQEGFAEQTRLYKAKLLTATALQLLEQFSPPQEGTAREIAVACNVSVSTIYTYLPRLEAAGYIKIER